MSKQVKLTSEERQVLEKLPVRTIAFFKKIEGDAEFKSFIEVVNTIIDQEKNQFFGRPEYDAQKLAIDHAFSRGGIAMIIKFLHIIVGAKQELMRREEERKKTKEA